MPALDTQSRLLLLRCQESLQNALNHFLRVHPEAEDSDIETPLEAELRERIDEIEQVIE